MNNPTDSNESLPTLAPTREALTAFEGDAEHKFAFNADVRIHYAAVGKGPLLVFVHGFPDYWLGWWRQMADLRSDYRVVAVDLRGYNLSDKPESLDAYAMKHVIADLREVIRQEGEASATLVGHDWGGLIAWHAAMEAPELVSRLVVVNMAHPWALARDLANSAAQRTASEYVRLFRNPLAQNQIPPERLSAWIKDANYKTRHVEAMKASSLGGMLNYYRAHWPTEPYEQIFHEPPHVKAKTLVIYGMDDVFMLPASLSNTWSWVDNELTVLTLPGIGHFAQHDAPEAVSRAIRKWMLD